MRISTASLHAQGLSALLARQADVARTQHQLVTGSKLSQAKEGPAAAATAQKLDHAVAELGQFERNSDQLQQRLEQQESALTAVYGALTRARELAIQANSGTMSQADRSVLAIEVRTLRDNLVSIGNRDDGTGRHLFAGTRGGVVPFVDNGTAVSYVGDDARNRVEVAPDYALDDTDPGSAVFLRVPSGDGDGSTRDMFATLDALATALEQPGNISGALSTSIGGLTAAQEHVLNLSAHTGARLNAIDTAAEMRSADEVSLAATLSGLRDTNLTAAASTLAMQLTALEAAQATAVKVQRLSLFDYL